jgi:hypothetical protein
MKTTYSDFQQVVEKWSKDFGFRNYRTSTEKGWFFIHLTSIEIEFRSLQALAGDLKGYDCELLSIETDSLKFTIDLNILNKTY